jgi:two-component system, OmpR family, sensor kinase
MTSLRRTALIWMTTVLTVVGLVGVAVSYWVARDEANGFLDSQLRQIALNVGGGLAETTGPQVAHDPEDDFVVQIWNRSGERTHVSHPLLDIPRQSVVGFTDLSAAGDAWRVYTSSDGRRTVQVAQRDSVRREIAENAAIGTVAPILAMIPLAWLVIGWTLGRFLDQLTGVASAIARRSIDSTEPIGLEGVPQEVGPLVEGMNVLIHRLHHALDRQRRFVSDAAHELRTPLTAIRLQIENLRQAVGHDAAAERRLSELERGAERASSLVHQLLRVTRYDASQEGPQTAPVDLVELLKSCLADHVPVADAKGIDLGLTATDKAFVLGNAGDLQILFTNLIDNAVRYTPTGGTVDVGVRRRAKDAVVEIADTGCGMPEHLLVRAFDRFFRAAPPGVEGSGLGLSIVKAIAERHDLRVVLARREEHGLVATVSGTAWERRAAS